MRLPSATLVGLGVLVVAAVAAVGVVVLLPVEPPATLRTATPARTMSVTERTDADERQVQLTLDTGAPRTVVTARAGTVTSSACTTGAPMRSGDVVAAVDGQPVVALASDVPLWRDLALDDHGDDVRGFQRELAKLGAVLTTDGIVGPETIRPARAFLVARGVGRTALSADVVERAHFAWVPAPENTVRSCTAVVGAPVPADGVLAELPAELRGARIDTLPVAPAPGARTLRVGSAAIAIRADGVVTDPAALAAIAALPEYAASVASAEGTPSMPATWELRRPRTVQVVPPTALAGVEGSRACVQRPDGRAVPVEVLGSELGQSFVRVLRGGPLDRVRTTPDTGSACR